MCRGITDGIPCECDAYDPPVDPKAPSLCRECAHGKSKHSNLPSTAAPHSAVQTKKSVLDVFTSRAEKNISERLPGQDRITDFDTARQDALKGFRVEDSPRQDTGKKPKGKKKAGKGTEVAVKETVASKVVLFVSGVKNQQLQGSTKAPTLVDMDLLGLHQCVATDVVIKVNATHQDCTDLFERLFSPMFQWMAKSKKGGTWVIISKECHTLRVVPKARPNGADIAQYQIPKAKTQGIMVFIGLTKTVPVDLYESWFTGQVIQEPSSGIESDNMDVLMVASSDGSDDNNSDYNPVRDPDAEDYDFSPAPVPFEKYETRKEPVPSKRKMESVDNDIEQTAVKKQKIYGRASHPTQTASSSKSKLPDPQVLQILSRDNFSLLMIKSLSFSYYTIALLALTLIPYHCAPRSHSHSLPEILPLCVTLILHALYALASYNNSTAVILLLYHSLYTLAFYQTFTVVSLCHPHSFSIHLLPLLCLFIHP
ncbi:hypothetical protein K438DRAFT_1993127 [Mycena galopus ATCC 62051]|nr:hypothetical protein K438DRAFT_1993127 [Mycena galopus ATCC 62051]